MGNTGSSNVRPVVIAATAGFVVSSGITVGLALLVYHRISKATNLDALKEKFYDLEQLNSVVDDLRKEIEELKAVREVHQTKSNASGKIVKSVRFGKTRSMDSNGETEYVSAWSSENNDSGDEFFDFADQLEETKTDSISQPEGGEALELFEKVDVLFEGTSADHEVALRLLTTYENEYGHNVEFLWRISKAYRFVAQSSLDDRKKELSYKAIDYGKRALAADDSNGEANKWFAIALGSVNEYVGVSDKIRNGSIFKEHVDKAIKINPADPLLHHLLGRFSFEVSSLSWTERKVAALIFSQVPDGSVEEALSYFKAAEELCARPWKENRLFVSRCLIKMGQYSDAMYWIDKALQIPSLTAEDQVAQDELQVLERKYRDYRRL